MCFATFCVSRFCISCTCFSLLFPFHFYSSIGTNCLSWKQVLCVRLKRSYFAHSIVQLLKFSLFHLALWLCCIMTFSRVRLFHSNLQMIHTFEPSERKRYTRFTKWKCEWVSEWVNWWAWEKDRMIKRKKGTTEKKSPNWNEFVFDLNVFFLVIFFSLRIYYT